MKAILIINYFRLKPLWWRS